MVDCDVRIFVRYRPVLDGLGNNHIKFSEGGAKGSAASPRLWKGYA